MVTMRQVVILFVGFVLFAGSANGETQAQLRNFDADPDYVYEYDDILDIYCAGYGKVDAAETVSYEFFHTVYIKNDEDLIVDIETQEFTVAPGQWDIKVEISTETAQSPNIFYTLGAEIFMREQFAMDWEQQQDEEQQVFWE